MKIKLPNALEGIAKVLKAAAKLEFGTTPGRVNAFGMLLALLLVVLNTSTDWLEDFIRMYKPKAVPPPSDFDIIFMLFILLVVVCTWMLMKADAKRQEK